MKHYACFSEAIREGAKLRPQSYIPSFSGLSSCAIQAGIEAITGEMRVPTDYVAMRVLYPYMESGRSECPYKCLSVTKLEDITWHLNDVHKWTREQIADWLEMEEEKLGFVIVVESETEQPAMELAHA